MFDMKNNPRMRRAVIERFALIHGDAEGLSPHMS
jgi:hypothetical protein